MKKFVLQCDDCLHSALSSSLSRRIARLVTKAANVYGWSYRTWRRVRKRPYSVLVHECSHFNSSFVHSRCAIEFSLVMIRMADT
ncbi:hypothetical protein MARPO_0005s0069 [Marchantia polymorpha]|uniref:Uncharacterized protein n=1 Tax=Marchantia polymorpha TaxID=3197 RepID=A0A2R6XQN7_MARPO|nr:hypothetical protein MARPO_0005s0069 [Marchantia polymorpha]|eukprot:PTQ48409.1 hypothetical protein MARPO_0005s0069 [Marchantia polymorpha]